MNGKVIVVTGASGALGKVVAETALTRGARVAGIDYAPAQIPATHIFRPMASSCRVSTLQRSALYSRSEFRNTPKSRARGK